MLQENNQTELSFEERLQNIQSFANELPATLIIHRVADLHIVYMNNLGLKQLGTTLTALQGMGQQEYFLKYFNAEDSADYVPKIIEVIKDASNEQAAYFQQVKIEGIKEWQLFVSNTKVFARTANGEATHLITIASKLDPVHHVTNRLNRLMEDVSFLRKNSILFAKLTKRETEVLRHIALGRNSNEIAATLFISATTVDTHRRNIRNKLKLKNNFDAVRFAQAYDLV